ncbi:hypothetical protein BaRGS_00033229 [Batillaria attramentaria]|uniref:C2H2-type domain-containing protein n=1 Tax=Batillaria attramentaria TaxID=370345 RepID=A0ABD0JLI3_9CAEN
MHAKIVIVVTRSFWSCATCKIHSKRSESIDHHLRVKHADLDGTVSCKSQKGQFQNGNCSDSELDVVSRHTCVNCSHAPVSKQEHKPLVQGIAQHSTAGALVEDDKTVVENNRQKSCRKQPKKVTKHQKTESVGDVPDKLESDGDDAVIETEESDREEEDKDWSITKRKLRTPKPRSVEKSALAASHLKDRKTAPTKNTTRNGKVRQNKSRLTPLKSAIKDKNTNSSSREKGLDDAPPAKDVKVENIPVTLGRGRKRGSDSEANQACKTQPVGKPEPLVTKPSKIQRKFETQDKQQAAKMQRNNTTGGQQKTAPTSETSPKSNNTVKIKKPVDKSKIATCCAPWLFDTGRKAGDKVNKKPRRMLLPEEKAAVRELYGIPAFVQTDKTAARQMQSADGRVYNLETQPINSAECLPPLPVNLMAPPPQSCSSRENGASHRNYMLNMFTPSASDFFPDSARAQESMYAAGYGGVCQQQNEHQQFTPQGAEFYAQPPNLLQSRSYMDYSGFSQSGPLPAAGVVDFNRQQVNASYSAQNVSITCQSPSQAQNYPNQLQETTASQATQSTVSAASAQCPAPLPIASTADGEKDTKHKNIPLLSTNSGECQSNQCQVCLKKFDSQILMQKHYQDIIVFETIDCKRCKLKFHGMHELNLHVFSEHETEKQGFCFTCNVDTLGLESLERHVHRHAFNTDCRLTDLQFHDCRVCKEELQSVYPIIRTHYYQHHITYVCAECFQSFDDVTSYVEHCKTHEGKKVFCSICGMEFVSAENLQTHFPCAEDMWAEDGKGSQCSKCELWCPNRAVVEAHRKQHRSQEDVEAYRKGAKQGFPCVSCEKVFKNKHACRRHIKMVHEGVSCYKHYCEFCGKGFLTKGHMRDHIALHHLGIKRYKCDYCDQQFVCGPTLRRHVRKEHTKHKPYECEHCGERFFEKTPLQRHLTTHTGLAPFMCEHCGKGFYTKHSFTNHGTTHSTARDFVCTGCQKGFTRKYNLQAHMKICKLV